MPTVTTIHDFIAQANGRSYRLMITAPGVPAPPAGYPVLWVLDGSGYNGLAVDMVRNLGELGYELAPAVVVSVTYPTEDVSVWMTRRWLDLTAAPPEPGPFENVEYGGLEGFLDMLAGEALRIVGERHAIDRQRMAIFGHSMGGVAVLHALFTRPTMFQSYLAISPSIHWGAKAVLQHEAAFAAQVNAGAVAPRIFIGMGGLEQTPPSSVPAGVAAEVLETLAQNIRKQRMVDNAAELAARLQALAGTDDYAVQWLCPADETHMSAPFATLRPALRMAFPINERRS